MTPGSDPPAATGTASAPAAAAALPRRAAVAAGPWMLGAAAAVGSGRAAGAAPGAVRFRILREGSAIGTHAVTLEEGAGGTRVARSAVDVVVRFAGVVVYRYWHRFAETWGPEGRLLAVASRLERNGTPVALDGRAEGGGFLLVGPEGTQRLPAEVAPLSWWDHAIFRRPLFDARAGRALRVRAERTALPGGGFSLRVTGDDEGTATYDAAGRWASHAMKGEDGSAVVYERIG
jgi:hypothetical protein